MAGDGWEWSPQDRFNSGVVWDYPTENVERAGYARVIEDPVPARQRQPTENVERIGYMRVIENPVPARQASQPRQDSNYITFDGPVHYVTDWDDMDDWCQVIYDRGVKVLGFDCEWKPEFVRGEFNEIAVVQVCMKTRGEYEVVLFHLTAAGGISEMLEELLEDPDILKAGVDLRNDRRKLDTEHDVELLGQFDLGTECASGNNRLGTQRLVNEVLGKDMRKQKRLSRSNWEQYPLSHRQKEYAALDAFVALRIYEEAFARRN